MLATLPTAALTTVLALASAPPLEERGTAEPAAQASRERVRIISRRVTAQGREYAWSVIIPAGTEPGGPGLLFLHGYGECGDDGLRHLSVGLAPAVVRNPERWPMVIIAPQKPVANSEWEDHQAAVRAMLDEAAAEGLFDSARLAVTGLSQGGHGTIWFAANWDGVFRAAAPVCGYIDRRFDDHQIRVSGPGASSDSDGIAAAAEQLTGMPIWLFHGGKDDVVPPSESRGLFEALGAPAREPGAKVCFTEFPDANHNSWDAAYSDPALAAWLVDHTR